jgi:hypothetical protein
VNGPKNAPAPASKAPSSISQQSKTQYHGRARVNHVDAQEAQQAPGVLLGEFLVEFTPATVLFDSGASHSFIATSFVEKHGIPSTHLEIPLVSRTPGSDLLCQLKCSQVRILLSGVVLLADLTVLPSQGIDVILGMDWLTKHKGIISCANKTVLLTDHQGKSVSYQAQPPAKDPMVFNLAVESISVVEEFMDVFLEELPGMPPEREVEFYIDLIRDTAPIAKRPYRMAPTELAELKLQITELQQKGNDSIWVIIDRLTKVAHFIPVKTTFGGATLARIYLKEIVRLHGIPWKIVSDRGTQFTSKFRMSLQQTMGTKLDFSTAYHPQSDGQIERVNKVLEDLLRACVLTFDKNWESSLPNAEFSYNNSYQTSIKMSPFEALYGRKCQTPLMWSNVGEKTLEGLAFVK